MIEKFHNPNYTGGIIDIPEATGDRYYAQDLMRDFRYLQDRLGLIGKDITEMLPLLFYLNGDVAQGAGASLDIPEGNGYVAFEVKYVDSFAGLPPTVTTGDIDNIRVAWTAQNDMDGGSAVCETYATVDDGATPNYVKVKFKEEDLNSRNRAKSAGSYYYEQEPFFSFVVDDNAPTDYELCLAVFTSFGGAYTFLESNGYSNHKLDYTTLLDVNTAINELDEKLMVGSTEALKQKAYRRQKTLNQKHGFWGTIEWLSTSTIGIFPKYDSGQSWVGVILNNGKYLELTTAYTINISVQATRLDGITSVLASSWYIIVPYEDSNGDLQFGVSWMPITTFSNANPTNTLTLNTVGGLNIGLCFPENSHVVVWQDNDEWETPYAWQDGAGVTTVKTKDKPKILSRIATELTLANNLENTTFTASSYVYQVDNFQPLDYSTGSISAIIGTRGWSDIGIRILTTAGSNIANFLIKEDKFIHDCADGNGYALSATTQTTYTVYRNIYSPVDKMATIMQLRGTAAAFQLILSVKMYYDTTGRVCLDEGSGGVGNIETNTTVSIIEMLHQLVTFKRTNGITTDGVLNVQGYII